MSETLYSWSAAAPWQQLLPGVKAMINMLSAAWTSISLVWTLADSGWTSDLELCIQKLQFAFGAWLITLLVECMAAWQRGPERRAITLDPSHIPALSLGTVQLAIQKQPDTRPGLALFCLWELHTTSCLIPCFWSAVLFWKLCRSCCVSDMHFAKQRNFHLVQGTAEPFQQVPWTSWPCAQSNSQQKKFIQHIRNKAYLDCQEKY